MAWLLARPYEEVPKRLFVESECFCFDPGNHDRSTGLEKVPQNLVLRADLRTEALALFQTLRIVVSRKILALSKHRGYDVICSTSIRSVLFVCESMCIDSPPEVMRHAGSVLHRSLAVFLLLVFFILFPLLLFSFLVLVFSLQPIPLFLWVGTRQSEIYDRNQEEINAKTKFDEAEHLRI